MPRVLALAIACLFLTGACSKPKSEPEAEIRELLVVLQDAVEAKERRKLLSHVSDVYSDSNGRDRDDLGNLFRVYFLRQSSIKLITTVDEIRLFGDTAAEVDLTAGLAGRNDGALGFSASAYKFEFDLVKEDDEWMLTSARWGRLGEELR